MWVRIGIKVVNCYWVCSVHRLCFLVSKVGTGQGADHAFAIEQNKPMIRCRVKRDPYITMSVTHSLWGFRKTRIQPGCFLPPRLLDGMMMIDMSAMIQPYSQYLLFLGFLVLVIQVQLVNILLRGQIRRLATPR